MNIVGLHIIHAIHTAVQNQKTLTACFSSKQSGADPKGGGRFLCQII